MKQLLSAFMWLSLAACSTSQTHSPAITLVSPKLSAAQFARLPTAPSKKPIDALVNAPTLYVHYSEDGAADATVLAISPDLDGYATNPIAQEVKDIVALREKALPLLIECLDDTRPTVATVSSNGYLTKKPIHVPVGHVCLDILLNIVGVNNKLIYYNESGDDGLGSGVRDGYYFRPDDYTVFGEDRFAQRPIVRIVKANWQRAYRAGKIKYDYEISWR